MPNNEFGKFNKLLRLKYGDSMQKMGEKLGVSRAYLSALELGKKKITTSITDKIKKTYNLNQNEKKNLDNAIRLSGLKVSFDTEGLSTQKREMLLLLNEKYKEMNEKQVMDIVNVLQKKKCVCKERFL